MNTKTKWVIILLLLLSLITVGIMGYSPKSISTLTKPSFNINSITSYRDIPGITNEEIAAIEALKSGRRSFSYGSLLSTEAFILPDGTYAGFTPAFCELLSGLFGIPFVLELQALNNMGIRISGKTIDFTGELTPTAERQKLYFMTDPIALRSLAVITYGDFVKLESERDLNGLNIGFLEGSITAQSIIDAYPELEFKNVTVKSAWDVITKLESGVIDAYINDSVTAIAFSDYPFINSKELLPLVYTPVSLTTANEELKPVISAVNKYIAAGGIGKLYELYKAGSLEYAKHELSKLFTEEEAAYIADLAAARASVPVALEHDYYPVCFYNEQDGEFQGVVPDMLAEITLLTGIEFHVATDGNTPFYKILEMLDTGEVPFVSALLLTPERRDKYLWSECYYTSHYALLSKIDLPYLEVYQVTMLKVGVSRGTAYEEMYNTWFKDNSNLVYYDSNIEAVNALDRGEVDLVMASENALMALTNYYEKPGYKVNIRFKTQEESYFGFNINEEILRSIIKKAQNYVGSDKINEYWTSRSYDYSKKLAEERAGWLVTFVGFLLLSMLILTFGFYKNTQARKLRIKQVAALTVMLENILNSINSMVYVTAPETNEILFMNDCMKQHYGIENNVVGQACYKVLQKDMDKRCEFCPCHQLDRDPGRLIEWEEHSTLTNRIYRNMDRYISWPGRKTAHLQNSIDVTELIAAREQAVQSNLAKSDFLARMSHEMRTPLNAIIGLTELTIDAGGLGSETLSNLKKIHNSGETLLSTVNDILDISKIEAGKLELVPEEYDVPSLINDTVTQSIMMRLDEKPIKFILDVTENLPMRLYGDELKVKQIFNNLLSNAFKYTREGEVQLRVCCDREEGSDTVWMTARISDTGIGIKPENLSRLFTDYAQFDLKSNRKIGGTGLGLFITKRMAEMMGGSVSVESEYGKGCVFTVRIRQKFVSDETIGPDVERNLKEFNYFDTKRDLGSRMARVNLPYARVLVVDDIVTNLDVAKGMLKPYQMQVDCVTSGQEAIDAIRAENVRYNAIFMDYMMPGMDGVEATRIIREEIGTEYSKTIPIIALTANAITGSEEMFLSRGFQAFLSKPIEVFNLDKAIRRWVRDKDLEKSLPDRHSRGSMVWAINTRSGENRRSGEDRRGTRLPENAPRIFGLDMNKGLERFGDEKSYLEVLRSYLVNTPPLLEAVRDVSEGDLEDYAIAVHGIKGSSRGICAEAAADEAEALENFAKNGNFDFVSANNAPFIATVGKLLTDIENMLDEKAKEKPKPVKGKPDEEALSRLLSACVNYDIDDIDAAMAEIESCEYDSDGGLAAWLRDNVDHMNYTQIVEKLKNRG